MNLLTPAEAAALAGVVPDTIRLWERKGKLPAAFRTATGRRLFDRADVLRVIAERERAAASEGVTGAAAEGLTA